MAAIEITGDHELSTPKRHSIDSKISDCRSEFWVITPKLAAVLEYEPCILWSIGPYGINVKSFIANSRICNWHHCAAHLLQRTTDGSNFD